MKFKIIPQNSLIFWDKSIKLFDSQSAIHWLYFIFWHCFWTCTHNLYAYNKYEHWTCFFFYDRYPKKKRKTYKRHEKPNGRTLSLLFITFIVNTCSNINEFHAMVNIDYGVLYTILSQFANSKETVTINTYLKNNYNLIQIKKLIENRIFAFHIKMLFTSKLNLVENYSSVSIL